MLNIKVMPDHGCHPLWWDRDSERVGNIDPTRLGLSRELCADLQAWAIRFDGSLNWDDPAQSAGFSVEQAAAFDQDGRTLTDRVFRELGPSAIVPFWKD